MLSFLSQAMDAVQRQFRSAILYIMAMGVLSAILNGINFLFTGPGEPDTITVAVILQHIAFMLATAVVGAAAMSVAFARIAREMDRPLWRCADDREALRLYFQPWFFLLMSVLTLQLFFLMTQNGLVQFLYFFGTGVLVPVGACIMFNRGFAAGQLEEITGPLMRTPSRTLFVIAFGALVSMLLWRLSHSGSGAQMRLVWPLLDVISAYFDCVCFCFTWRMCMDHRAAPPDYEADF